MADRFWDLFYKGHWVGMSKGRDLAEAKRLAAGSLPRIAAGLKYAEWFGRMSPLNCKTSGGRVADPT